MVGRYDFRLKKSEQKWYFWMGEKIFFFSRKSLKKTKKLKSLKVRKIIFIYYNIIRKILFFNIFLREIKFHFFSFFECFFIRTII